MDFKVSEKNQEFLLKSARQAIVEYMNLSKIAKVETEDDELNTERAVFVTLTKNDNLRGCIGNIIPQQKLIDAVCYMAVAAAFDDPRFPEVTRDELDEIKIEISVLSSLEKAESYKNIIPEKHGVMIRNSGRSGLFLPQVWEHFEPGDIEGFMGELCSQKAGLSRDCWKNPKTEI
ncbi:MAG: AmmeMemoRadiSam system protein A, partial [Candidatus Muiribacteriota bacterium]